jgi:phosphohistidine swiveling domain-containing protein
VRNAKLAPEAAVTVATHLVWDGRASKDEVLARVTAAQVEAVQNVRFEPSCLEQAISNRLLTKGLPASPGAAVGRVVTSSEAAASAASTGQKVVLVRPDTSPDDLPGMLAAIAIVTSSGGATSHAAVVARGLGKPAVVGCSALSVAEGDFISVDGYSGAVISGEVQLAEVPHKKEVNLFLKWLADAQGTRWPRPRLDFETVKKSMTAGQLLNNFYLTDAIARQTVKTALEPESRRLRTQVHVQVAEHIATYLVLAVCGELRYAQESWRSSIPELAELLSDYKILEKTDSRGAAQSTTMDLLATLEQSKQVRFLQLSATVFDKGWEASTSIGGVRWGNIARAAIAFLTGKLPHSVFADHAFDLQHNNGSVFGKHQMLRRVDNPGDWRALRLSQQLDAKKELSGVKCLFERLDALQSEWLPEVLALYRKGEKLGLWLKTDRTEASRSARDRV